MPILYAPGWGYPAVWWKEACALEGFLSSWGYYEKANDILPENYWIVAHSFGLYMLPEEIRRSAKGIIWYGGFFSPLPFADKTLLAFAVQPLVVLQKFRTKMFFPNALVDPVGTPCLETLLRDLQKIVSLDYVGFWKKEKDLLSKMICAVGKKDCVVLLQADCRTLVFPNEGHMPMKGEWKQCVQRLTRGSKE